MTPLKRFELSAVDHVSAVHPLRRAEYSVAHLVVEEGLKDRGGAWVLEQLRDVDAPRSGVTRGETGALLSVRPDEVILREVVTVREKIAPQLVPDVMQRSPLRVFSGGKGSCGPEGGKQ